MWAGVSSAFSSRCARWMGEGRYSMYASRTGSGISISRSPLTSWRIRAIGNSGARSAGPIGWCVPGWSGGLSGAGRAAEMLYQALGIRDSSRTNWVRWERTLAIEDLRVFSLWDAEPSASARAGKRRCAGRLASAAKLDLVDAFVARRARPEVAAEQDHRGRVERHAPTGRRIGEDVADDRSAVAADGVGPRDRQVRPERPRVGRPPECLERRVEPLRQGAQLPC